MNWRITLMAFLIRSKIGEVLWAELTELVLAAENSGAPSKSQWVINQLTWENTANWFKNLCLEIAVAYMVKR